MAKAKKKKTIRSFIQELVEEVVSDYIAGRKVRCNKCKHFFIPAVCDVFGCSVCLYTAGRCTSCGGEDGARRSVIAHVRMLSNKKLRRRFGMDHYDAASAVKIVKSKAKVARLHRSSHLRAVA